MVAMIEHRPTSQASHDKEGALDDEIEDMIASYGVQAFIAGILRSKIGEQLKRMGGNATLRVIQVLLRQIVFNKDPQLEAEVIALGSGVLLHDEQGMRVIGAKHGITWQAVSKRVVTFVKKWRLPPSEWMKSEANRAIYQQSNKPRET